MLRLQLKRDAAEGPAENAWHVPSTRASARTRKAADILAWVGGRSPLHTMDYNLS